MKGLIVNNLWLKVISLILAVIAWFYISGELSKREPILYSRPPIISKP